MGNLMRWMGRTFNSKDNRCPDEDNCLEVIRLMLDEESTSTDNAQILKHVDGCYRCYDNFELEKAIREEIKKRNENKEVPQEVVDQILAKIDVH